VRNPTTSYTAAIFDLGGVLIDWNPRHLYRKLFHDEAQMERFLAEVTTAEWNGELDAGRSFAEAIADLQRSHPDRAELIAAYWERWPEMLGDVNRDTAEIVRELKARGVRVFALSEWSAETFHHARAYAHDLSLFEDIQISGEVGMTKADPRAFALAARRFDVTPATTVFIDDVAANVESARNAGFTGIRFTTANGLREELTKLGLL
jgi:2-haloacid dehalogenase